MPGSTPLLMLLPHVRLVNVAHGEGTRAQMAAQRVSHVWVHETNVIFQRGLVRVFLSTVGASPTLGNMGNHSSCHFSGPQVTCNQQPGEVSTEALVQQKHTGGQCSCVLATHTAQDLTLCYHNATFIFWLMEFHTDNKQATNTFWIETYSMRQQWTKFCTQKSLKVHRVTHTYFTWKIFKTIAFTFSNLNK